MSFWQKLFGSKQKPAQTTSTRSTPTRAADSGTSVRPTSSKPSRADISTEVSQLINLCEDMDKRQKAESDYEKRKEIQREVEVHIREIGTKLDAEGGIKLMQKVGTTVAARSAWGRYIEGVWDGIGEWQG